ncbi:sigma-70 family RNA polymerase sigma factor [Mesorhizobium sp. B3-1-6]|nr:sigma-70 family RNA polymerase sigma factor [Mesorhizobium sp. B3-1-6]
MDAQTAAAGWCYVAQAARDCTRRQARSRLRGRRSIAKVKTALEIFTAAEHRLRPQQEPTCSRRISLDHPIQAILQEAFLRTMNSGSSALQNEATILDLIPALRAFARTFCRDKTDADDLVQETLLKGIAHIDQFEPGTRMKSWLFTIMRNTFYTKHKVYMREAPGATDCASARSISYGDQEWHIRSQEVHAAIGKLPPQQREVLVLIAILGVSYEETASICGCAIGTIKSRLNRARMSLIEDLGETSPAAAVDTSSNVAVPSWSSSSRR